MGNSSGNCSATTGSPWPGPGRRTAQAGALAAAADIGYPVALKTDEPGIAHKSDVGGVVLGIRDPDALRAAYQDLAERLGRRVLVCETIPAGPELSLGLARDHELGPLLVVGAGGVLVELLADRAVALPPVSAAQAHQMLGTLRAARLLAGVRGQPAADLRRGRGRDHRPVPAGRRTRRRARGAGHQPADLRPGPRGGRGRPGRPPPARYLSGGSRVRSSGRRCPAGLTPGPRLATALAGGGLAGPDAGLSGPGGLTGAAPPTGWAAKPRPRRGSARAR